MQSELFDLLRTVLKARGITYATLASRLGLSEPTIKRIFSDRDCKLSRMSDICAALDLSLEDLMAEANRVEVTPTILNAQTEMQLAEDKRAFHLFLLLLDGMTPKSIQALYDLSDTDLFLTGRRLEALDLVEILPANRLRLLIQGPVRFRRDGPLHQTLLKLNMDFVQSCYLDQDTDPSPFHTQSRRISTKTARHIQNRLQEVRKELSDLARKDQLTQPDHVLRTYKLSTAISPIIFSELLDPGGA